MNSTIHKILSRSGGGSLASVLAAVQQLDRETALDLGEPLKVAFLRNFTVEGIEPYLKWHLYRSEIGSTVTFGGFDTVAQDIITGGYQIGGDDPDTIVLSLVPELFVPDLEIADWHAGDVSERLVEIFDLLASRTDAIIVVNTFQRPAYSELGSNGNGPAGSLAGKIAAVNDAIRSYAATRPSQFFIVDWEVLLMTLGESASYDRRFWYVAKAPFKPAFLDLYAREIGKIGRALKGKNKKCLVLDCDDTLWGGIVGEDGTEGIVLDRNEYPGSAYYDFQKSVVQLANRGVVLAICSKNEEQDVWKVLDEHPHSLLKRDHFAAHRINWQDKASNLESLAEELNLGLDSFVFVDDSEFECDLVRQLLPEVTVRQVPRRLSEYPGLLRAEGLFDKLAHSAEDRARTGMYQAQSQRRTHAGLYEDVESYLESLELKVDIHAAEEHEVERVAQLTQKTNQFNLTTRRYSETQIRSFMRDPNSRVLALSVQDRFGDSGLTGLFIATRDEQRARIDELLLSCRVLGRHVERTLVDEGLRRLNREWAPDEWIAEYIPTTKNQQVARFWDQFGFAAEDLADGSRRYRVASDGLRLTPVPFISVSGG